MAIESTEFLRINLGSGGRAVPGWVCIDRSPNVLLSRFPSVKRAFSRVGILSEAHMTAWDPTVKRHDIRSLPYPDGSVDAVYSSHALEHIYLDEARQVLADSARVLRSGGMIRIALPDATVIARRFLNSADDPAAGREYNDALLAHPTMRRRGIQRIVGGAGGHVHRWQPTAPMVKQMLEQARFSDVRGCNYKSGDFPDLDTIETRPESFFLEAVKA
jgi:predicted SAM-dependent methyltransferase